jgi:hypothetical protein
VAFGFRALGEGVDDGVDDGPYWDVLTAFAEEPSFYIANDTGTLVCGPITAEVADDNTFEEARRKTNAIDDPVEWYFTLAAATAPGDTGSLVAKVGTIAMPLIGFLSAREGRRAAVAADPLRDAAAVGPGWLGAGHRRAPAQDRSPLLCPHSGR